MQGIMTKHDGRAAMAGSAESTTRAFIITSELHQSKISLHPNNGTMFFQLIVHLFRIRYAEFQVLPFAFKFFLLEYGIQTAKSLPVTLPSGFYATTQAFILHFCRDM